ncbi:MAG: carbohydrate kinase [Candidatus Sedimenticola sp. PURPLELP]
MTDRTPVLFGEVLFDCFEDGSRVLGGAPFNVAWHLQAFGCSPVFISRVGNDPMGQQIRNTMERWGMSTAALQHDSTHPTGEVSITLDNGQPNFEIVENRAYDHIQPDMMPPMNPSLVYHGSLGLRLPGSASALDRLLEQHPAPVFMDVNLRPPWWERDQLTRLLDRARWVKINDDELIALVDDPGDLQSKANRLMQQHDLDWVIVTLGAQGAFALDNDGEINETAPSGHIEVVDTVGAGDAFASVCILGLLHEWPIPLIMKRAQQFASVLVAQRGATISDTAIYQSLIADWRLEP